jgi:hypothetical protein
MRGLKNSVSSRISNARITIAVMLVLAIAGTSAAFWCASRGYILYYGDAEAHLNIARRVLDSRTPGPEQFGTVWLLLPHLLLIPFAMNNAWWFSGVAAAIPSILCFILAGTFLFLAGQRIFDSTAAALTAVAIFALNPNILYLQTTSMTEPVFAAALAALLWSTVRYRESPSWFYLLAAAAASTAASLTRYEGWFLIPFLVLYLLLSAKPRWHGIVFIALASLGPLAWLAHNAYYYSNPLEFYNGDYSALAIYQRQLARGIARYPGDHDLGVALRYYAEAARFCIGWLGVVTGMLGIAVAVWKRQWWPIVLFALPPLFYVWSIRSSGTPIYVPDLWPNAWYNTRYALAVLPLVAMGSGFLVDGLGRWGRKSLAVTSVIAIAVTFVALAGVWISEAITWKESVVNSEARRKGTREAAGFLAAHYRPGSGLIYSFGDLTGVLREAHIPLVEGLHEGNRPDWDAAVQRPDLFLREGWALAISGDKVSGAILRAGRTGPHYTLRKQIIVEGAPVIEIYERQLTEEQ